MTAGNVAGDCNDQNRDSAGADIEHTILGTGPEPSPPGPAKHARTEIDPGFAGAPDKDAASAPQPAAHADRTEIAPDLGARFASTVAGDAASGGDHALSLPPGTQIEQFELIRELGRGGMGQVFLARDTKLGRKVALKFLALHSAELTERFVVEARATARCQHENIVVIYEADEWKGQPYMALEYLEGQPLSTILARGAMSPRRAIETMIPVVGALCRAHELNIVHRDLKPDNIFVTRDGVVKVLDFGIARLFFDDDGERARSSHTARLGPGHSTRTDGVVGTMPFMSPEQWGAGAIDHRTDLWAVGIIFWYMLASRHPLAPLSPESLCHETAVSTAPMPSIATAAPELPTALERIVDRCLAKDKHDRFDSAAELLEQLLVLAPGRHGRRLEAGESPYPGLRAFQDTDADRFFGRDQAVLQVTQRLEEVPLVGVIGPSGVGKSSLLRAGVVPALRGSGDSWEVLVTRPGRDPLAGLASLIEPLIHSDQDHKSVLERLRSEPGYLGAQLRLRAKKKRERILLFVDQFEELYTLVESVEAQHAFTATLAGVADDASTPLRVVVSMRSDFLDRATDDREFMEQLMRGLVFLPAIDRAGMEHALTEPLDMVGHRFESEDIVTDMLNTLEHTPGALPLLQFAAAKLWDARDKTERTLTKASYQAMGGLAGALATHADDVVERLSTQQRRLARAVFVRLVTSDGTSAILDISELRELGRHPSDIPDVVDQLVRARLLAVRSRDELHGSAVELVHESLITRWPTLRRWLDETAEDSAFLEQLRAAARQWDRHDRPAGLLWRGEASDEAQRFARRYKGQLAARQRDYLDAVVSEAHRVGRRRRRLVVTAFAFLIALVAAGAVALLWIRDAERTAQDQKQVAQKEAERALKAEAEASDALDQIQKQIETIKAREQERDLAKTEATAAQQQVKTGKQALALTSDERDAALRRAEKERDSAEAAKKTAEDAQKTAQQSAQAERKANTRLQTLLEKEQAKVRALETEKRKISTELKK